MASTEPLPVCLLSTRTLDGRELAIHLTQQTGAPARIAVSVDGRTETFTSSEREIRRFASRLLNTVGLQ
ncbi:MAG: hypothetical protein OXG82_08190 [Gammaproteobacteria bacterium]|nr:hypothetical protein [Gammaproteobacteria bacterium]